MATKIDSFILLSIITLPLVLIIGWVLKIPINPAEWSSDYRWYMSASLVYTIPFLVMLLGILKVRIWRKTKDLGFSLNMGIFFIMSLLAIQPFKGDKGIWCIMVISCLILLLMWR